MWICPDPLGHLQATGVDAAGRKQYLYHPRWRELRDRDKFTHMVRFATALPKLRRGVLRTLRAGDELDHDRVLSCAIRLLDIGLFRIGSEQYADDDGGTGLATVRKENVTVSGDEEISDYLKRLIGDEYSAKDFRTWNATVLAAVSLAADGRDATTRAARKRAIDGAVRGVAEVLGNTPAVERFARAA